jgi:hypothetical protein
MTMTLAAALKSYFFIIVALASIVGSTLAVPYILNLVNVSSGSDSSTLIPDASAQSLPFRVDHHLKIKEKVGDPLRIEEEINDGDRHCEMSCKYIEYKPGSKGKAGLAFNTDNPVDFSGAKRVHFFLMGDKGGETVKVKIAGKSDAANMTDKNAQKLDNPFKEKFAKSTDLITLPNDWQRYEVPLDGADLKDIVAPFAIELLKGQGSAKQIVYLKHIVYDNEPVDDRFLLPANNTTSNATNVNTTSVEGNSTQGESGESIEGNNSNNTITGETSEAENDNNNDSNNETATSTTNNNTTADMRSGNQITNFTGVAPVENAENLAPVAMLAADSLVAHPGNRLILDGSLSSDPDGDKITYRWSQSDGPDVEIIGADTVTPTVTIPTLDQNNRITIDLVVSDGEAESNKAFAVIDVQYVEEIENATEQDMPPDEDIGGEGWSATACGSTNAIVDCLTDSSDSTFASSDRPDRTDEQVFSFQKFDDGASTINNHNSSTNNIASVTAQVSAKKTGASSFISFLIDRADEEEHYVTPSISIISDSFEEYSFTWKYNPVTGEPWTIDSFNSLVAGYRYSAGQGSVQISEFDLIVSSLIGQEEQDLSPSSSSAIDGEASNAEGEEEVVEDNGDNDSNEDEEDSTTTTTEEPAPGNDGDAETDEGASIEGDTQEDESTIASGESEDENLGQNDGTV